MNPNRKSGSQTTTDMKLVRNLFLLPCLASVLLTSCVVPGNPFQIIFPFPAVGIGYGTYDTLPPNYVGNTYYYGNRYYYGGRYESGSYYYGGRPYSDRYFHNGRYYYGGRYQHIGNSVRQQNRGYYYRN